MKSPRQEIRDLIKEHGTPEEYNNYIEYEKRVDNMPPPGNFIICSPELAKILNELNEKNLH